MENKAEDEIRKRWEQEAKEKAQQEQEANKRPRKRMREIEYTTGGGGGTTARITEIGTVTPEDDTASELGTNKTRASTRGKGSKVAAGRTRKAKGAALAAMELEYEDCIELD